MRKNRGIVAGMSSEAIKKIIEAVFLKAFAEEDTKGGTGGEDNGDEPDTKPTVNYEDLIAKARKEEKEKQYKTIEKLKVQVNTLTQQHNDDLVKIADLDNKLAEANKKLTTAGSGDSEEIKTLKETIKTLEGEKVDLDNKVKEFGENKPVDREEVDLDNKVKEFGENKPVDREEVEAEVRKELEAEYEVKTYKAEKMAELKDDILVPELVMGTTKEEIDASIQSALTRSAEIKKNLGLADGTKKPDKRTPKSPSNPSVGGAQDREVSLERLATMDVRSPEYAKLRRELGLK